MQRCQNKRKNLGSPLVKSAKKTRKNMFEKSSQSVLEDTQQMPTSVIEDVQQPTLVITNDQKQQTNNFGVDEEDALEKAMVAAAIADEERERNQLELRLLNEKHRLLEDVCFPITKSETKYITMGVIPLRSYEPCVKLHNELLTAAICMNIDEFGQFVTMCENCLDDVPDELSTEQLFFKLKNYDVLVTPHKVLQFKPVSEGDVYKPLFLAVETIVYVLSLKNYILNTLNSLEMKRYFYPGYDMFIKQVVLSYIESDAAIDTRSHLFNKMLVDVIEDYENNGILYEVMVKLPFTLRAHVEKELNDYYRFNDCI